jgi:hypothetical protein
LREQCSFVSRFFCTQKIVQLIQTLMQKINSLRSSLRGALLTYFASAATQSALIRRRGNPDINLNFNTNAKADIFSGLPRHSITPLRCVISFLAMTLRGGVTL